MGGEVDSRAATQSWGKPPTIGEVALGYEYNSWPMRLLVLGALIASVLPVLSSAQGAQGQIPRMSDGRPNLQGIWQVRNRASYDLEDHVARHGMPAGRSVVEGGPI